MGVQVRSQRRSGITSQLLLEATDRTDASSQWYESYDRSSTPEEAQSCVTRRSRPQPGGEASTSEAHGLAAAHPRPEAFYRKHRKSECFLFRRTDVYRMGV